MSAAIGPPQADAKAERRAKNKIYVSYGAVVAFALLTLALVAVHGGSLLNFAFPLLATSLGGALFVYHRSTYIAYTWWIWLFTPEVRRLVDFQTHFHNISPVMLSQLLVTGFALLAVARRPKILLRRSMVPFALFALATLLAFFVGSVSNGFLPSAFEWGNWLEPLAFGVFLIMDNRALEENRQVLLRAVVIGLAIVGAYGVYQFFHLPPWDAAWLTNSQLKSEGRALAEEVRIFGTLNDSGTFAGVLAASLVFILVAKGPLRIAAGAVGVPAFLLAEHRTYWAAAAIGAAFVFWRMGGKSRVRIGVAAIIIVVIAVPILTVGPVAALISARVSSIGNVQNDQSAQLREALYQSFIITAVSQPIGNGFGALGVAAKLTTGQNVNFDSGLLEIPYEFGWVGGLLFVWSVYKIALSVLAKYLKSKDPITTAASGLFFAMLAALLFGQVFEGAQGLISWMAVGMALGAPDVDRNPRIRGT